MTPQDNKGPEGLGGWLILVIIGLVVSPVRIAAMLLQNHAPIFTDGTWDVLTTPGSEVYHPLWAPLIGFELVGNLVMIALAFATLFLLVLRSRAAPIAAIGWYGGGLLFVVVDALLAYQIPMLAEQPMDAETMGEIVRSVVAACIWIPYFLVSKRVKATFTRDWPARAQASTSPIAPE